MQLSNKQWGVIRQIAAEQARAVVSKEYKLDWWREGVKMGFSQSQLEEIARVAQATSRKAIKQADFNSAHVAPVTYVFADPVIHGQNIHLNEEVEGLKTRIASREEDISRLLNQVEAQSREIDRLGVLIADKNRTIANLDRTVAQYAIEQRQNRVHRTPGFPYTFSSPVAPEPGQVQEGDRWRNSEGEVFTYFLGQWRRRSELEGFAAAKKYL